MTTPFFRPFTTWTKSVFVPQSLAPFLPRGPKVAPWAKLAHQAQYPNESRYRAQQKFLSQLPQELRPIIFYATFWTYLSQMQKSPTHYARAPSSTARFFQYMDGGAIRPMHTREFIEHPQYRISVWEIVGYRLRNAYAHIDNPPRLLNREEFNSFEPLFRTNRLITQTLHPPYPPI